MPGQRVRLPWLGTLLLLLVSATCANSPASNSTQAVSASASAITTLSANAFTIEQARKLVAEGHKKMADANKARVSNVRRNNYSLKPGSLASRAIDEVDTTSFVVTDELAAAAALVAEADAAEKLKNGTLQTDYSEFMGTGSFDTRDTSNKRGGESWWMANLDNLGTQPFGGDNSYKVFRNVRDFGAKGNGHDDDTAAINRAIADGNRCGANCYGSTVKAAVVYFPPGTYLVSGSILSYFHTQLIGDATNFPTIKAAGSFQGLGVISTDFYYTEGGTGIDGNSREWYINTANFYRQIRNFIIDIRDTPWNTYVAGLHYQVAQATSLSRVNFICSSDDNTTQQAIFAENGSGGFMSDLVFHGGNFGIYGGSQQFTAQRLTFSGCKTAVQLIWDWGWIWREIAVSNCKTAFRLISEDGVHHTGSLLLQDSTIQDTDTAILSFPPVAETRKGTTGITIDNCAFSNVKSVIKDTEGKTWVDGSVGSIDTYSLGPTFSKTSKGTYSMGNQFKTPRVESLTKPTGGLPKPAYFSKRRPEYEGAKIVQMKHSTKGDGSTDDTAAFQKVINDNAGTGNVIFIDAGSYILTDTITIPSGSRIVGQAWAQLVASGPKFQDERNPHVLFRVGAQGEKGNVEIQDLLFTTRGPTAGLVAVEWNLEADGQGTAGLWDCHVRIGGAKGTDLTVSDCPTSSTNPKCKAGAMMFHMTNTGSAYIENMWLWVADHDIDDANMTQLSVYVARGMLVESTKPVWLYGTASEHAVFYQYEFFKAKNVLAAMIQTESAYFQPNPLPPAPFQNAVDVFPGDPDYKTCSSDQDGCDESWALIIDGSADITISGAGLYSWFRNYAQTCVDTQDCQKALTYLKNNKDGIHIYNMITIGAQRMIDSKAHTGSYEISARDYTHVNYHPYWSQISLFDPIAIEDDGSGGHNVTYVPRGIWDNGTTVPTASCIPPCTLVLPPSPLPDGTTIPWPSYTTELLSSIGPGQYKTVTTTLSVKPITTTEIEFATVTINEGDGTTGCFSAEQSVTPTSFIVTLPPSVAPIPPTHFPIYKQGQPVSTPTETATPTFYSTSHGFTFQPQATMSVYLDDHTYTVTLQPGTHDGVTYAPVTSATTNASPVVCWTSAAPKETCTSNCGKHDCDKFGCDGKCGEFGCDGGCGLWGCGGGCGLFGCGTGCAPVIGCPPGFQCPIEICGGLGCLGGTCGNNPPNCKKNKANDCTYVVTSTLTASPTKYRTRTETHCTPYVSCSARDKKRTTTRKENENYATATVSLHDASMGRMDDARATAIASEIMGAQAQWNQGRFNATINGGDGPDHGTGDPNNHGGGGDDPNHGGSGDPNHGGGGDPGHGGNNDPPPAPKFRRFISETLYFHSSPNSGGDGTVDYDWSLIYSGDSDACHDILGVSTDMEGTPIYKGMDYKWKGVKGSHGDFTIKTSGDNDDFFSREIGHKVGEVIWDDGKTYDLKVHEEGKYLCSSWDPVNDGGVLRKLVFGNM